MGNNIPYNRAPIDTTDGILSFIKSSDDFDEHWESNDIPELPPRKFDIARQFLTPLYTYVDGLKAEKIMLLDAGCGDGVHLKMLDKEPLSTTSEICALDISRKALEITRKRGIKAEFVQGSVSELPFSDNGFDAVFSYGVIAYSDDPEVSFKELVRCTKKGGVLGLWIYPKNQGIGGFVFDTIRKMCKALGNGFTTFLANLIVPFLFILPTNSKVNLGNSTWKQCREVVLVNIAPTQLFFPTRDQILRWFHDNNMEVVSDDPNMPVAVWAIKK